MAHPCNPSTWEVEAEDSRFHGHHLLYSKSESSLDYVRLSLKETNKAEVNKQEIHDPTEEGIFMSRGPR